MSKPASDYSYTQLADIYNRAREDYIVPMPMNAKRMEDYVQAYDVSLAQSIVALDSEDGEANGICMLGLRGERAWVTRLGVIPTRRRRHTGLFLMEQELASARQQGARQAQLEVIKGNEPAIHLFETLGFQTTRELLVIRRAPMRLGTQEMLNSTLLLKMIDDEGRILDFLGQRGDAASWIEETPSLLNGGSLRGVVVQLPDGESGWLVFQRNPFQLSHFVLAPNISAGLARALVGAVHQLFPMQDTKLENLPADSPLWPIYQELGYVEAFRRIEMVLVL